MNAKIKTKSYNTKERKKKRMIKKVLLSAVVISAMVIGWSSIKTNNEITAIAKPVLAQEIVRVGKEKDIIIYFFEIAEAEGLTKSEIVKLLETIRKESNFEQYAIGYNAKSKSWDLGYWQINTKFHPEVSRECSFDLQCSTKQALRIYKEKGLGEWSSNK